MKRLKAVLICLLLVLCVLPVQAEDTSFYYQYLKDTLIPQKGLVNGGLITAKGGKLGSAMADSFRGILSAAVMDFDGDGLLEMITVEGDHGSVKNADYAWRLCLYGESGLLDTKDNVVWVESGASRGTLSVDIQRSEGKVYIICDANIQNMDSSDWDYHSRRFYTVENRLLADLSDYESLLHSNSGISLQDTAGWTTLCSAELAWDSVQILDFTHLAEYAGTPSLAQLFIPPEINLADTVPEIQDTGSSRLMKQIEEITPLLHISTDTLDGGEFAFVYDAENGCRVKITSDGFGTVREVWISDSGLYDKNWALKHIDDYLNLDMTEELKSIFRVVAGEPPVLIGSEKSDQDRIVFRNQGEADVDKAHIVIEKAVYTAASGSVTSSVTVTWPDDAEQESEIPSSESASPIPSAAPDAGNDDSSAAAGFTSYTAKTTKKGVNVRQQPDQSSKKVTQLGKGEEVTVIGSAEDEKGVTWYQIITRKGKEGYIRGDLLKRVE